MQRSRKVAVAVAVAVAALVTMMVAPAMSNAGLLGTSIQWKTLKAPAPSWYTQALHRQVLAAGPRGVGLPAQAAIPTSSLVFQGIRPGQLLIIEGGTLCSSNFVFTNGADFFIGTAGHCGEVGDQVTMLFLPAGLVDIGEVVLSVVGPEDEPGNDFALISIDPSLNQYVSPSMAYWGGPTGVFASDGPAVVQHAGWGLVVGTGGTPRVGLGTVWTNDPWFFEGVVSPGDSGSGANVLGGLAAGNITHIFISLGEHGPTLAAGTSMTKIMQILGPRYELATCSAIPWPLPGCP